MPIIEGPPPSTEEEELHEFEMGNDPAIFEANKERISLARGLKKFREEKRISQILMAKMMDVSKRSYIDYERHGRSVPSAALANLLAHTELDMNELFTGQPMPVGAHFRQQTAMQSFNIYDRLKKLHPDVDEPTLREGTSTYCAYFDPSDPFNQYALIDIMNSIFYERQQDDNYSSEKAAELSSRTQDER